MAEYTARELERAARLKEVDESLRGAPLEDIAKLLSIIPAEAYRHEAVQYREPGTSRERGRDR